MKYPLVGDLAAEGTPVAVTCRVLEIAPQPDHRWLANSITDTELQKPYRINALIDAHADDPEFGYRYLADEAEEAGFPMATRTAWRLCSTQGVSSSSRGGRRAKEPDRARLSMMKPPLRTRVISVHQSRGHSSASAAFTWKNLRFPRRTNVPRWPRTHGFPDREALAVSNLAEAAQLRDDGDSSAGFLETIEPQLGEIDDLGIQTAWAAQSAIACASTGDLGRAQQFLEGAHDLSIRAQINTKRAVVHHAEGELALAKAARADAAEGYRRRCRYPCIMAGRCGGPMCSPDLPRPQTDTTLRRWALAQAWAAVSTSPVPASVGAHDEPH